MCGILGSYSRSGSLPATIAFAKALDRLRLRGPDDSGLWHDQHVRLGHRRLAIVDLSPSGHQPMESSDQRFVIVFNGEIYNHRSVRPRLSPDGGWRGTSDTETLIEAYRAWGTDCLQHLNGMFAFAIWDRFERSLFIARDRTGVKPLYYSWDNDRLCFASRPRALVDLSESSALQLDPQALRAYLELGYIPAPLSYYKQIRKLQPGHFALASERGLHIERYWDFRHLNVETSSPRSEEALLDELNELVTDSVRLRLMSDVPLGAFLSGGVDSALIVAAMKSLGSSRTQTFTIGFREAAFDEAPAAAQIARHLQVDHTQEVLSVDNLLELLPTYVDQYDEPFADSSAFPTMAVSQLARRDVSVVLSGDGGDELFGGYHYYPLVQQLSRIVSLPRRVKQLLSLVSSSLPHHRLKLLAGALTARNATRLFNYLRSVSKDYPALLTDDVLATTDCSASWFDQVAACFPLELTPAELGMRLDQGITLPDLFLQKVDVATMAFSLEGRCPLTDYRIVEWSMGLPLHYKLRGHDTKYLLKKLLCRYLPVEMIYKPKKGFGVPIGQWLRGPLFDWARELIHDDLLMSRLPLDKARVHALFEAQTSGARDSHPLLWSVLMLLCYVNQHELQRESPRIMPRKAA